MISRPSARWAVVRFTALPPPLRGAGGLRSTGALRACWRMSRVGVRMSRGCPSGRWRCREGAPRDGERPEGAPRDVLVRWRCREGALRDGERPQGAPQDTGHVPKVPLATQTDHLTVPLGKHPPTGTQASSIPGGQALGAYRIVDEVGATWVGAAVIIDALESHATRRELAVRSLMHHRELSTG